MAWSEDSLHRWIARRLGGARRAGAAGHDAAVLAWRGGALAACVDQCIEGVHWTPGTSLRIAATKAASRALSDLAATAAEPRALLLAIAAPRGASERALREAVDAVAARALEHGARLVGGDLACAGGPIAMTVTALGRPPRGEPPGRDRARPGDVVVITGPVGGSSLGRHLRFEPRVAQGRWLHARGARALMDVSDGLAWDLFRLARSSGVRIDLHEVPVHRDAVRLAKRTGRSAREHALSDGEDHELVATLPARALARVLREARRACPSLVEIGRVRAGAGLWIAAPDGRLARWSGAGGWRHGGA